MQASTENAQGGSSAFRDACIRQAQDGSLYLTQFESQYHYRFFEIFVFLDF